MREEDSRVYWHRWAEEVPKYGWSINRVIL